MSRWMSPQALSPEVEILVRRWQLPRERVGDIVALLRAHEDGATALRAGRLSASDFGGAASTAVVGRAAAATPLILFEEGGESYLQTSRYHSAEQTIARQILARVAAPTSGCSGMAPIDDVGLNAGQRKAVACALSHRFTLITGGPGTGKTYTLARLLALQLGAGAEAAVIQLAAPTGKAADRMKEAVESAADRLPGTIGGEIRTDLKRVAAGASTLHRLLGANPATGRCRFNQEHPLPCRILIVDECSMVDTLLWQALLLALRPDAQLVLVGDPHQLESVRAGDVLGSLVRFARTHRVLGDVWIELTESQRFKHRPAIGALADAIVNLRPGAAISLLRASQVAANVGKPTTATSGLTYLGDVAFEYAALPHAVRQAIEAVAFATEPAAALAALTRVRFLAAHREHSFGAAGLNAAIQRHLDNVVRERPTSAQEIEVSDSAIQPFGSLAVSSALPIIINRNHSETRLSNGSVGVIMAVNGARRAFFPAAMVGESPRSFALSQLPEYSLAWAMTIHRSQGSEFDHVVVYLPRDDSPLATRELLYTAVTRAKDQVYLSGPESSLRFGLSERAVRCTLLERALAVTRGLNSETRKVNARLRTC